MLGSPGSSSYTSTSTSQEPLFLSESSRELRELQQKTIPVVLIEGDGIGKEVSAATVQVINHALSLSSDNAEIRWEKALAGKEALTQTGELLPVETIESFLRHGAGLKGPLETPVGGGFRSVNVALRKLLDLYANVRPVRSFEGLENPLRTADQFRLVIIRENTEDVYAGLEFEAGSPEAIRLAEFLDLKGKGLDENSALGIKPISERASRRIVAKGIEYALANGLNRITLVHKGNIMKATEGAFRDWGYDEAKQILGDRFLPWKEFHLGGKTIADGKILVQDRIADAMFQDLILAPQNHQVLVTMNLNGDYLSDAAAACVGGLGLAPGLNEGDKIRLAEAVHGTAPDIAGKGIANPSALLLSGVLLLRALELPDSAKRIELALEENFSRGEVTGDLAYRHKNPHVLSTQAFADSLCQRIDKS
ncbi:MAG: hypothetical protein KDD64_08970 [Bdellovibrionales bacterium]|nr:hypothetical protein [Bdellovibrionales bacterium]